MEYLTIVFVALAIAGVHGKEFYSCRWISRQDVDCDQFVDAVSCGTDLVTYKNKCEFSRAHCIDQDLHLLHPGACDSVDFKTTPIPALGSEIVFDFFCTSLSHKICGTELEPVCASDGRTYPNTCEYEKSKCTHRDLSVASFGTCPTTTRSPIV